MLNRDAIRQLEKPTKSYHPIHIIAKKFVEPYLPNLYLILQFYKKKKELAGDKSSKTKGGKNIGGGQVEG